MNKTNGTYDVQLISKDGSSWSHSRQDMFDLFSLRADEVRKAAESEAGIPFAVRYHGGKFDIWVNNTLVIADAYPNPDGGNHTRTSRLARRGPRPPIGGRPPTPPISRSA